MLNTINNYLNNYLMSFDQIISVICKRKTRKQKLIYIYLRESFLLNLLETTEPSTYTDPLRSNWYKVFNCKLYNPLNLLNS